MLLSPEQTSFVESHRSAAMITIGGDGLPKVARVAIVVVDGKIWSSGTEERVRTRRLRRDPRCTLFVFDEHRAFLTLETTVRLLDGPDAAALNLRLFRVMQSRPDGPIPVFGQELDEPAFLQKMVDDHRLVYEFEVHRAYGII